MAILAISGEPGCGSTTIGKLLAKDMNLSFFSAGEYFKSVGKETTGIDKVTKAASEFWKTEKGSSVGFHQNLDSMTREKAISGNIVIEGKLAIHTMKDIAAKKIWLKATIEQRAKRISKRESILLKEAEESTKNKEKLERENWLRIYGFDYFDQEKDADFVIDTSEKSPEEIVKEIKSKLD